MQDDEKDLRGVQVKIERKFSREEAKQLAIENAVWQINKALTEKNWTLLWYLAIVVLENGRVVEIFTEDTDNTYLEEITGGIQQYIAEHNLYEFGLEELLCDFELKRKDKQTNSIPNTINSVNVQPAIDSAVSKEQSLQSATQKAVELFNGALNAKNWKGLRGACVAVLEDGQTITIEEHDTDSYVLNGNTYDVLRYSGEHILHKFLLEELLSDFELQLKVTQLPVYQTREIVEIEKQLNK